MQRVDAPFCYLRTPLFAGPFLRQPSSNPRISLVGAGREGEMICRICASGTPRYACSLWLVLQGFHLHWLLAMKQTERRADCAEGFDTADLKSAKALLDELDARIWST